tara:strand:+ start:38 stop:295 length:258 start_codon:yes stop_codon:yes gene_type:complete
MLVDHLSNYRRALPLSILFGVASITAAVFFIVYAAEWESNDKFATGAEIENAYRNRTRAEYSYYASVISLLILIVFFNGYHLTKL